MDNVSLKREYASIKATKWWSLFLAELEQREALAVKNALSCSNMEAVYRNQGMYKALSTLIKLLADPDFLMQPEYEENHKED